MENKPAISSNHFSKKSSDVNKPKKRFSLFYNIMMIYDLKTSKQTKECILTSAQALGRTSLPIRPASLALNIFSKSGVMVELELHTISRISQNKQKQTDPQYIKKQMFTSASGYSLAVICWSS